MYPVWYAGQRMTAGMMNSSWLDAQKTVDQTVANSTTVVDDFELFFSLPPQSSWHISGWLYYDGAASGNGGIKLDWSAPAGATMWYSATGLAVVSGSPIQAAATAALLGSTVSLGTFGQSATARQSVLLSGFIQVGNAGTLRLRWAQNISAGTATTLWAGSWLKVQRKA